MRIRADLVVLAVLVAGSAYAVWTQVRADPLAPYANKPRRPALALGEKVDFRLKDIGGEPRTLSEWKGEKATVLYFWTTDCPCVDQIEMRVKEAYMRFPESKGVKFIGIDANPDDDAKSAIAKMADLKAPYYMVLDPKQEVAELVGASEATTFVVLDGDRRMRYRGALDDSLEKPTKPYLVPAIEAVLAGKTPATAESKPYGCPFPGYSGDCPLQ
jgi:peroxiredoxin